MAEIVAKHDKGQDVRRAGQRQPETLAAGAEGLHGPHRVERVQKIVVAVRLFRTGIALNISKKRPEQTGCGGIIGRDSPGEDTIASPPIEVRGTGGPRRRLEVGEISCGLGRLAQRALPSDGNARLRTS
jgi:hypothetical protein